MTRTEGTGCETAVAMTEINATWKRLMRRMHPDTDGTDGMAMLLYEARDVLLRKTA